jgi:hypothetical protein
MNKTSRVTISNISAWSLSGFVSLLALLAWGSSYQWALWPLSAYQLFPLLGLLAFSIMWSHYMVGALKMKWSLKDEVLAGFYRWTGYAVLVLICLHPGLLIYQRYRDGYGLPPHSYESYVASGLGWVTILGTASLLVFLAFELRRFFGKYRWWHYVVDASDLAMLAIVYHALKLGSSFQKGWYHTVWIFYFISLVGVLAYKYTNRFSRSSTVRTTS